MSAIVVRTANPGHAAAWSALLYVSQRMPRGWTIVGGQMVLLWCLERKSPLARPTNDIDTVLDVRAHPDAHLRFTRLLAEQGFRQHGETVSGRQHRWVRGEALIDVLIPRYLGERADRRPGAAGGPALATPGGQHALDRTESVAVVVDGQPGTVRRPNLVGALIAKSATVEILDDPARDRHLVDFLTLLTLLGPRDLMKVGTLEPLEASRLTRMSRNARLAAARLGMTNYEIQLDGLERLLAG